MAIIKCKMCGGDLDVQEGMNVAECEYCGTKQTVPLADSEKKMTLFARANRLRFACEFDKAAGVYESLVAEFPEEAEAYWGLVLCKYGIEYVDDPATGRKVPTCHRSSFESIMDDGNFEQVLENTDTVARKVYREEAKAIEELRKGIIEVSSKEEPYDIFICYKETAENGERTLDSVLAQDIYDALTEKGYRVFFSRITLEDKLGQEYEPYIFAALNSAKVMLAIGTDYEYYNAVWVKNEWSRFLQLIAQGQKKILIPCYKNIDAYDMPKEFAKLQAQDLGKIGALQDLLRGIEKILGTKGTEQPARETVVVQQSGGPNVESLLKRGDMALEDGDWEKAKEFFDQVLNINAECAEAYLGLAMAQRRCMTREDFSAYYIHNNLSNDRNLQRAKKFGDSVLQEYLEELEAEKKRYWEELEAEKKRIKEENERKLSTIRKKFEMASIIASREFHIVGLRADGTVVAVGDNKDGSCNVSDWMKIVAISAGDRYTVGLKADGTVVAVGDNKDGVCNVSGWRDIVAVFAGDLHTVGLKKDGTVVATGFNRFGQCDVSGWRDIVAISVGKYYTVGLKADGTVVATGFNISGQCDVSGWRDIVAISAGKYYTVGLKADGTVVSTGYNENGQCDVTDWRDIIAISMDTNHVVGLKADGTVVSTKDNKDGVCNVSNWTGIAAISAGANHAMGLKADGTVVATWDDKDGVCNVSSWRNIVAIFGGDWHAVGVKADGTVVTVGYDKNVQSNVSDWRLFNNIDTLEEELKEARECWQKEEEEKRRAETERQCKEAERIENERKQKKAEIEQTKASLESELANLKGLFSGRRRREIEAKLVEIEKILEEIS